MDATSADLSEEDAAKLKERVARHIEKGSDINSSRETDSGRGAFGAAHALGSGVPDGR